MIDKQTLEELHFVFQNNLGAATHRMMLGIPEPSEKRLLFIGAFLHGAVCAWHHAVMDAKIITSPIEARLFAHLLFINNDYCELPEFAYSDEEPTGWDLWLRTQHQVGRYTADFHFTSSRDDKTAFLVVECDGHDFHERTKEQAAHDKKRDRYFAAQGIAVLRFTGSEIWRDAASCSREIESFLSDQFFKMASVAA